MNLPKLLLILFAVAFASVSPRLRAAEVFQVLKGASFAHHVEHFNSMEGEDVTNFVANSRSFPWMKRNVPFFECPDREVEEMYYYRWWSFRKHIVQTTNGFVLTEFLTPVRHAGIYNTISCAAGFHLTEGRWMRVPRYLDNYTTFWLRGNGGKPQPHFHKFSSWFPAAVYDRFLVNGDLKFTTNLLDSLTADYRGWEQERRSTNGLFWQFDVADGMEESISGSRKVQNLRPTINSYMFANARAIAEIARLACRPDIAREFDGKAGALQRLTQEKLWNAKAKFFEVLRPEGKFSDVREAIGFVPWCFNLPGAGMESAWKQFMDPKGFHAPFGITTAERSHPAFRTHGCCKCEWDGAVWPFATSQTLGALANLLREYHQSIISNREYWDAFLTYVHSQHLDGKPYIGEYLDETTGQWFRGRQDRDRFYNHSLFADIIITGVVGLRPRADNTLDLYPLLPDNTWKWFCLDGVKYHGQLLTILWDADGTRYNRGEGLIIIADGKVIAQTPRLGKLTATLP